MFRTHNLSELNIDHIDATVILSGFVNRRRDHGGLIFIDLRDRYGLTQIVFDPSDFADAHKLAESLRGEYVIRVEGKVRKRPDGMSNSKLPTGEIEVLISDLKILSEAQTPPFEIDSDDVVNEELRLKYRYLDLRRSKLQKNLIMRHNVIKRIRDFLSDRQFLEIETPVLIKGTPEGSREYMVPSRLYPGSYFVLPQSPQQLKQLLMVAGMDKYFQIARCFRDEDLRGDRQPEFTQLDLEMSFVTDKDVIELNSELVQSLLTEYRPDLKQPDAIPHMTYDHCMNTYGSDKPDLRFDLPFADATEIFQNSGFQAFASVVANGGIVKVLKVPAIAEQFSRKVISELEDVAKIYKAKGMAYIIKSGSELKSPILKFMSEDEISALVDLVKLENGDILFFAADEFDIACNSLGAVRLEVGKRFDLIDETQAALLWVTEFPMFEKNDDGSVQACHHPFTSPMMEDVHLLDSDPHKCRSIGYDIVLNGSEIGGGSQRIHDAALQSKVFDLLNISKEDADKRFGHILNAFSYGVPPHAGIAWGLDRFVMILCGEPNIREVIAFPKDSKAKDLMLQAPSEPDMNTLKELRIKNY